MKNTKPHRERKNPQGDLKRRARLEGALARHLGYAKRGSVGADKAAANTEKNLRAVWL